MPNQQRIDQAKRATYNLVEMFCSSMKEQGKNTSEERTKLIAQDHPVLIFVARLMELHADIDDWCVWQEEEAQGGANA